MYSCLFIFLIVLHAGIISGQMFVKYGTKSSPQSIQISIDLTQHRSEFDRQIVFYNEYILQAYSETQIFIEGFNSNFAFGVFQLHSCMYNVTLWTDKSKQQKVYGSNLGTTIHPEKDGRRKVYQIENDQFLVSVNVSLAVVAYSMFNPLPGGCYDNNPMLRINHQPNSQMIWVRTPTAAGVATTMSRERLCDETPHKLNYSGFYFSLPRNDFTCRTYFDGIKAMMTVAAIRRNGKPVSGTICIYYYGMCITWRCFFFFFFRVWHQ